MRSIRATRTVVLSLALLAASGGTAHGMAQSDRGAAIITYPYVTVDAAAGVDTHLQLVNLEATPIDVRCYLENANRHCSEGLPTACRTNSDCPGGFCAGGQSLVQSFTLRLTADQPIAWRASVGAAALPCDGGPCSGNSGSIPATDEDPFVGNLRCVAITPASAASERNALIGTATIERFVSGSPPVLDVARYNAVGTLAVAGEVDNDPQLVIGGANPEYEGCANVVVFNHFFDGGIEPSASASQVFTTLSLVPCSANLSVGSSAGASQVVQYSVYNEFEQRFATSSVFEVQQTRRLSAIDVSIPSFSIFSAGVVGTLTGQTRLLGGPAGLAAVAVEEHHDVNNPDRYASAAFQVDGAGERLTPDILSLDLPTPVGTPTPPFPVGTATSAPTATPTVLPLCVPMPRGNCRSAGRSRLVLEDRANSARDTLSWEWRQGQLSTIADFFDPQTTANYAFCLYTGTAGDRLASLEVPPGGNWKLVRARGYRYRDRTGSADGIVKMSLRGSGGDRAQARVRGKGENLPDLDLSSGLPLPVVAQLLNTQSGVCWEGRFDAGSVVSNQSGRFEASR